MLFEGHPDRPGVPNLMLGSLGNFFASDNKPCVDDSIACLYYGIFHKQHVLIFSGVFVKVFETERTLKPSRW